MEKAPKDNSGVFCAFDPEADDTGSDVNSSLGRGALEEAAVQDDDEFVLAERENCAICVIRICLLFLLVGVAVSVSYSVHNVTRQQEFETFETTFHDQASKIKESFEANADSRMAALAGFSQAITSYAVSSGSVFPNVTMPDFERQAAYALKLSNAPALLTFPIVQQEQRVGWEAYSKANQAWLEESWDAQDEAIGMVTGEESEFDKLRVEYNEGGLVNQETSAQLKEEHLITPVIFKISPVDSSLGPEDGPSPYAPIWQLAPVLPIPMLINFNSWSHPTRATEISDLVRTERPLLSSAVDFRDDDPSTANCKSIMNLFLNRWKNGTFDYEAGPVSDIYLPIFDHNGPDKQIKSVLTAYIYWQSFFVDILHEGAKGIVVILKNTCNQMFSYEINGRAASYLGKGDWHDPKYNHMMIETGLGAVLGSNKVPQNISAESAQCFYKVQLYPSQVTEETYMTLLPNMFAVALVIVFCFTSAVFCCMTEPVRKRLYDSTVAANNKKATDASTPANDITHSFRSADFLEKHDGVISSRDLGDIATSDPIANNSPHATVFFADIVGFTKWSSQREPADVFRLLESIYTKFNKLAKARKVFKVETIGDCYVAVTGLPQPQPNHALRMTQFAAECMTAMNQVIHRLVPMLGADTAALSMGCGLHSRAVTAGILRGDKARFQLFGDTVNTAARMESTGTPGQIHCSEEQQAYSCLEASKVGFDAVKTL